MNNIVERVSLSEVCRVEAGAGFPLEYQGLKNQEFPFFKVGDMNSEGNEKEMHVFGHSISEETRKKLGAIAFPAGTIVFPKIGAAIATNKKRILVKPSCVDNNVMALIPSENLLSDYLFYLLQKKDLSEFANTGNPPSIRQTTIEEWVIPLPPLPEQRRIADLLSRADRLRRLRRVGDTLSASLLQSVFLEMFGEPKANPKGWYYFELDKLKLYISDGNYSSKYPRADEFVSKGIPFIRANNLKNHTVIWDDMRFITPEKHEYLQKGHIRTDDLLITTRGNIGLVGLVPSDFDDANINAQLVLIRCKGTKLNPRYLLWVLEMPSIREQFDYLQTGTALQQLPVGNLIQLEIPVPPLSEQEQFAAVVRRVESLRGRAGESARQGEGLFQSLLDEAFRG